MTSYIMKKIKLPRFFNRYLYLALASLCISTSVAAESPDEETAELHLKVEKLCEKDPLSPKCKKFLDGKYRRHNDAEKIYRKADIELHDEKDEKSYQNELRNELTTFCRKEPDAPRCKKH